VLRNIHLTVEAGETIALVGRNRSRQDHTPCPDSALFRSVDRTREQSMAMMFGMFN
jgi:hypothetical protein